MKTDNLQQEEGVYYMTKISEALQTAAGAVSYGLTNDYMFRAVFQESNTALKHLLAALLDIPYETIGLCEIMNPIILGEHMEDKSCILDIKVKRNNDLRIEQSFSVNIL